MEIQLPFIHRILNENDDVECHIWNLTRTTEDNEYVSSLEIIHAHPKLRVINDFRGPAPWTRFNDVYDYYTADEYLDCLFVKMDDDVVFIQTDRFQDFVKMVDSNRNSVISAKVINNGACTPLEPKLNEGFEDLNIPLLDVHLHGRYANMAHRFMLDNWATLMDQPVQPVPTADWLSINLIGYDYEMGKRIARKLGKTSPEFIAGRRFRRGMLGDEGMVNTIPRIVCQGFLAAHLSFGPQKLKDESWDELRRRYTEVRDTYLWNGITA